MTTTPIGEPVSGARASRNRVVVIHDQFASRAVSSIAGGVGGGVTQSPKLVDGVLTQVDVVRGLLDDDIPVHWVLCFVE